MFSLVKKRRSLAAAVFLSLFVWIFLNSAAGLAWENFEFSDAALPSYEKLRGVPDKDLPDAIQKAVTANSRKSLAIALESYALDVRYADIVGRICASLTPNVSKVYSLPYYTELKSMGQLPYYQGGSKYTSSNLGIYTPAKERLVVASFAANSSYNTFSAYRVVLIDSFMLDTLYRVAQYKAHCGSYDNAYEQVLASYAAQVERASKSRGIVSRFSENSNGLLTRPGVGVVNPFLPFSMSEYSFGNRSGLKWEALSFHTIERDGAKWANPAHIPLPGGYDSSLSEREAVRSFEKLLAPILCHELSHSFLGHSQARLNKTVMLKKRLDELMTPSEANAEVRRFLSTKLTPDQEIEADIYAAKLGKTIGLRVQDFEEGFWFLGLIEKAKGGSVGIETHPRYVERRRLVERVYMNEL
ncbi:MAG: hypothetical protein ACI376_03075 [Candidatus Bruticola sp.]